MGTVSVNSMMPKIYSPFLYAGITWTIPNAGGQPARPVGITAGAEPKGHFQDALLSLGSAHAHFGHVQVWFRTALFADFALCSLYFDVALRSLG